MVHFVGAGPGAPDLITRRGARLLREGAIREQMDALDAAGLAYDDTPGVSGFCGAAALNAEYPLPGVSQSVIITRMEGRTPVPGRENLAGHAAGICQAMRTVLLDGPGNYL